MKNGPRTILLLSLLICMFAPAPAAWSQDRVPPGQDQTPPGQDEAPPPHAQGVKEVTINEAGAAATPTAAVPYPACRGPLGATRYTGFLPGGAQYVICIPWFIWNRDLVVYAHGYEPKFGTTPPGGLQPGTFKDLTLGGSYLPTVVQLKGYAFAMTNYRDSGLVVQEAQEDLIQLVQKYIAIKGRAKRIYLVGASEGGIIAAKIAENPTRNGVRYFDGVLSACGPIGDFQKETNYLGDLRVVWDWVFNTQAPGAPPYLYIPYNAVSIDPTLVLPENPAGCSTTAPATCTDPWNHDYAPAIAAAVFGNQGPARDMLDVLKATYDPAGPTMLYDPGNLVTSMQQTMVGVLWYSAFATNDANYRLGGQPFDNLARQYAGSPTTFSLTELNLGVQRYGADPTNIGLYETTGNLKVPMLTLHGVSDPVQPYWHEPAYRVKVQAKGKLALLSQQTSTTGYGHCQFSSTEVLSAFDSLVRKVKYGSW